jgi:hypothetical protein
LNRSMIASRLSRSGCAADRPAWPPSGALVAELLAADAQHLGHHLTVHVVGQRRVVQHAAVGEPLLRGAADLAAGAGDVVERLVDGIDAERAQRLQHPVVEERVGVGEGHALHERAGTYSE